jgi:hypothetical protein
VKYNLIANENLSRWINKQTGMSLTEWKVYWVMKPCAGNNLVRHSMAFKELRDIWSLGQFAPRVVLLTELSAPLHSITSKFGYDC